MPDITVEVTVPHPASDVWAQLRQIERHVEWMSDAESITFHGDQREGIGTSFDCRTKIGPLVTTDVMTITRWDDEVAMGVTHRGIFTGRGEFVLNGDGVSTRITWHEGLTFPWWCGGVVGATLARPILRAIWKKNLARLRVLLDSPTSGESRRTDEN
jgi:carbon monoxide dehydrogenase subunit G